VVFILFLAVMSLLFAASEVVSKQDRRTGGSRPKPRALRNPVLFWLHILCALVILAAVAWAFAGSGIRGLTPLYIGEVAAAWAFGLSWTVAGIALRAPARARPAR
jgi:hypothetical protein